MPISEEDINRAAEAAAATKLKSLAGEKESRQAIINLIHNEGNEATKVLDKYNEIRKNIESTNKEWEKFGQTTHAILGGMGDYTGKLASDLLKVSTGMGAIAVAATHATKVMYEFYEHTAAVNRTSYDINASLGHIGDRSKIFADLISSTAFSFSESADNVAEIVRKMATAGFSAEGIREHLGEIVARSKLWSELTPDMQIKTMTMYMKEFGYSQKEANDILNQTLITAQSLKTSIKEGFDISQFLSNVNEVALGMRRFGLEASDALAVMSALSSIGMEQARATELAKGFGDVMSKNEIVAFSMKTYYAGIREEIAKLEAKGKDLNEVEKARLIDIKAQEEAYRRVEGRPTAEIGFAAMQPAGRQAEIISSGIGSILERVGAGRIETEADIADIVGMAMVQLTGFSDVFREPGTAEAFAETVYKIKEGTKLTKEEESVRAKMIERGWEPSNVGQVLQMAFAAAQEKQVEGQKTLADLQKSHLDKGIIAADATTTIRDSVKRIENILAYQFAKATEAVDKTAQLPAILERVKTTGEKSLSIEELATYKEHQALSGESGRLERLRAGMIGVPGYTLEAMQERQYEELTSPRERRQALVPAHASRTEEEIKEEVRKLLTTVKDVMVDTRNTIEHLNVITTPSAK